MNKALESTRIKPSNSNFLILAAMAIGVLLKDFAKRLKRTNETIPYYYFTCCS